MKLQINHQQRRFYMMLPVLVLPFITAIFWALGGGKANAVQVQQPHSGLNIELPVAYFDKRDELWDKFSLYEQAKRDSLKYQEARRSDPYYEISTLIPQSQQDTIPHTGDHLNTSLGDKKKYSRIAEQETVINEKLEQLTRQLNQPDLSSHDKAITPTVQPVTPASTETNDIDRLERMMEMMTSDEAPDPEMQQIESVLDKIMAVQNPPTAQHLQGTPRTKDVLPVATARGEDVVTLLTQDNFYRPAAPRDSSEYADEADDYPAIHNDFYGIEDNMNSSVNTNSIIAVIHDEQTIGTGSTIRLRLLQDVIIQDRVIRKDQFVYGVCTINKERLTITINSIRAGDSVLPVELIAHDLDGMEGIFIPGAVMSDVARESSSQSIQDIQLYGMDSALGMQAAGAGIEAAKSLFTRKARQIKVTVKAGYQVILIDKFAPL